MREAGVLGGKAAGSGAGGSMFFLGPDDPPPSPPRPRGRWACDCCRCAGRATGVRRVLSAERDRAPGASLLGGSADLAALARRLAERRGAAPGRCSRSSRRSRRCSRPTGASVRTTAPPLAFDPWSPAPTAVRAAAGPTPASATTAPGPASSISGSPSGRRRWPRWPRSRVTRRAAGRGGGDPLGVRLVLLRLSQPRQRARSEPALLLHLSRVHLGDELPRGRRACCARAARSRTRSPKAWASSPKRPPTSSASSTRASRTGRPGTTPRSRPSPIWFEDEELLTRAVAGADRHARPPRAGLRRRRHVVRGRELPPLRASRPAHGDGLGPPGGRGPARRTSGSPRGSPRHSGRPRSPRCPITPSRRGRIRGSACSLAQPMYLELWEVGLARLGDESDPISGAGSASSTRRPRPTAGTFDSYLHEAGRPAPAGPRTRADLSWWALLEMAPSLPEAPEPWAPGPMLLEEPGARDSARRRRATPASSAAGSAAATAIPTDCTSPSTPTATTGWPIRGPART